jgi:catechol 2,3-dioxygenase-like lactoylglutathione lyase family enzyme
MLARYLPDPILTRRKPVAIDHIGIPVTDSDRSKEFYIRALAPLGITMTMTVPASQTNSGGTAVAFGSEGEEGSFWIGDNEQVGEGIHVAFPAGTREAVDEFHRVALAAGGRDNGAPGLRPDYGPNYYAAFVYDPDGHNIEAVCYAEG